MDFGWTVYCKNCGRETKISKVRVPCEDFDYPRTGMKDAWVSECCEDEVSESPVTDVCAWCGITAEVDGDRFEEVDGDRMCWGCKQDYRRDHPSMEEEIARAEHQSDVRTRR